MSSSLRASFYGERQARDKNTAASNAMPFGVYRVGQKYRARAYHDGTLHNLGTFASKADAAATVRCFLARARAAQPKMPVDRLPASLAAAAAAVLAERGVNQHAPEGYLNRMSDGPGRWDGLADLTPLIAAWDRRDKSLFGPYVGAA